MSAYTILFIAEALIVLIGFLVGLKRGFVKATVRFIELIVVSIVSLLLSRWITSMLYVPATDILHSVLEDPIKTVLLSTPEAEELVLALAGALVLPLVFVIVFALLKLFSLIGLSGIAKIFTRKKEGEVVQVEAPGGVFSYQIAKIIK